MVKQARGIPGVKAHRMAEALDIRHCALSLVGEPIMYPHINEMIGYLHERGISSFLVTNATFPDAIRTLKPVTQLYLSIDASTRDALEKIDRPLHKDFWERFQESVRLMATKPERTVFRLTLVSGWNTAEMDAYKGLVDLGRPDFIEVKGVTYCGESKASTLSMKNVPWHDEVVSFVQRLCEMLPDYEICSEHEHSNSVLVAHKKFFINNEWHVWIDYEKFHSLLASGKPFTAVDYQAPMPHWAVFGASERGFDPTEDRVSRAKKPKA